VEAVGDDHRRRRNRYDGRALHDETPGSQFWYWHDKRQLEVPY
jgi:hypothetical protein